MLIENADKINDNVLVNRCYFSTVYHRMPNIRRDSEFTALDFCKEAVIG